MTLIVGPTGTGKTLILKRLQSQNFNVKGGHENLSDLPATIPTVGTNMVNVITGRKTDVVVRELGGTMAPIWNKYYPDSTSVIFVMDISNRLQISCACVQLLTMLSVINSNIPVALVFNKHDMPTVMQPSEFESLLRLDDLLHTSEHNISVFHISAKTGKGLSLLIKWIAENHREKQDSTDV